MPKDKNSIIVDPSGPSFLGREKLPVNDNFDSDTFLYVMSKVVDLPKGKSMDTRKKTFWYSDQQAEGARQRGGHPRNLPH